MLLGNKKKQGEEQNWCIVLSHLPNEIDKKRISRRISEIFSLSKEEASDLVSNTPIILLDNLTHNIASRIKEYFRSEGADVIMTNDIFFKRKCYRTVWPEPPNLSFLDSLKSMKQGGREQPLNAEEALKEIRSLRSGAVKPAQLPPPDDKDIKDKAKIIKELEAWRKESTARRDEMETLKRRLDKDKKDLENSENNQAAKDMQLQHKEREVQEIRAQLSGAAEKYEALKDEFKKTKLIYEDRLSAARAEKDGTQAHLKTVEEKIRTLEDLNRKLRTDLEMQAKPRIDAAAHESLQKENRELKARIAALEAKAAALPAQNDSGKIGLLEDRLKSAFSEIEALKALQTKSQESLRERETHIAAGQEELARKQAKIQELEEECRRLGEAQHSENQQLFSSQAKTQSELEKAIREKTDLETALYEAKKTAGAAIQKEEELRKHFEAAQKRIEELEQQLAVLAGQSQKDLREEKEKKDLLDLKLTDALKEAERLRLDSAALSQEKSRLENVRNALEQSIEDYKNSEEQLSANFTALGQKYNALIAQYDRDKLELLKTQDAFKKTESSLAALRTEQEKTGREKAELEKKASLQEAALREAETSLAEAKRLAEQLSFELSKSRNEMQEKNGRISALEESLNEIRSVLITAQDENKTLKTNAQEHQNRLEKMKEVYEAELAERGQKLQELTSGAEMLAQKAAQLEQEITTERENHVLVNQALENKERELESHRRQVRELHLQMEQREAAYRRNQLIAELADKEGHLKRLIEDQSRLEHEIKEREENMRQILRRQEEVEKEIVAGKQAQRHLLEQAKKENQSSRFSKYEKKENGEPA